jgi:lariat debranching enzyme
MEWKGNYSQLFKWKPDFEQEAKDGTLGSVAATAVLERLRPAHWFSAHMHVKFAGMWEHSERQDSTSNSTQNISGAETAHNADEIELDVAEDEPAAAPKNDAEIDLDMEDEDLAPAPTDISTQTEGSQNTNSAIYCQPPFRVPSSKQKLLYLFLPRLPTRQPSSSRSISAYQKEAFSNY